MGYLYKRFGFRLTLLTAALLTGFGYLGVATTMNYITDTFLISVLLSFFFFLVGNGSTGGYYTSLQLNIEKSTLSNRGSIIGMLVFFFGISSKLYTNMLMKISAKLN